MPACLLGSGPAAAAAVLARVAVVVPLAAAAGVLVALCRLVEGQALPHLLGEGGVVQLGTTGVLLPGRRTLGQLGGGAEVEKAVAVYKDSRGMKYTFYYNRNWCPFC